jgi:head-tail adaptor
MTVVFEGRTFQIHFVEDEDEMHFFLNLYCSEIGQNAGAQT